MKNLKKIPLKVLLGLAALLVAWLWLAWVVLSGSQITLINLFWVAASGIIVFVPLWRRVIADTDKEKNANGRK